MTVHNIQARVSVDAIPVMHQSMPVILLLGENNGSAEKMVAVAAIIHRVFFQTPNGLVSVTMIEPMNIFQVGFEAPKPQKVYQETPPHNARPEPRSGRPADSVPKQETPAPEAPRSTSRPRAREAPRSAPKRKKSVPQDDPKREAPAPKSKTNRSTGEYTFNKTAETNRPPGHEYLSKILGKTVSKDSTPNELLGVEKGENPKKAYHKLCLKLHPDKIKQANIGEADRLAAEEAYKIISEAYKKLDA